MLNGFAYCQMHYDDDNNPIDFTYLAVNGAFGSQTGLYDVVGKRVSVVIPGIYNTDPKLFELYGSVAKGGSPKNFEFYLISLNMWLSISVYCPGIGYFVAIFEVITERKLLENALRESEDNYRTFFDTMGDMILVANMSGNIIFTNKALKRKLGYSSEELSEMNAIDLNPSDIHQEAREIFDAMFKGERETCPLPLATKSGKLIPVESRLWFGRWNGNDCIFGISKDISAEQEAKQRFESIFRNSPIPMALSKIPEQTFIDVNVAFLRTLGYSDDEIIGKTAVELGLFPQMEEQIKIAEKLISDGYLTNVELLVNHKNGRIIHGLFSGEVISINGRKYLLTAMIDITRRKLAEVALMESEKKYRQLVELAHEGIWTIDTESITTYVNPRMAEILGYAVEEMQGSSLFSFMDEQGIALAKSNVERRKQGIREQHEFEFIRKDGKRIYTSIETTPINGDTGNYLGALALVADITERKVAEDKLKESEEVSRSLINAIMESAALVDSNGIVLAHNEVVTQRLGLSKNELLGKCVYDVLPPEVSASRKVMIEQVFRTGKPVHFEDKRSGRIIFNSIFPIFDITGNVNRIAIFGNDITEIKQNEKKLLESEKMLTNIIENLPMMLFVKDAETLRFVKLNKAGEELLGFTRDEMIGKSDYDFFSKEEAEFFILNDLEVLETKKLKEITEEKIQTKYQGKRILSTKKIPILNNEGNAEFLLGISEDITSRKETENALRESEKMYRTLLNASPEGIVIMDTNGLITEISNITLEIFGAENKQEFLGEHFFHLIPDEEIGKLKDVLTKTQVDGLVQNVEVILTKKNKSQFICELSTTLIQETDGRPKAYMAIIRDISQRKKIEQQLIRTERMVSLGEMASGMAHEINQPLLSITLSIENMLHKIEKSNALDDLYFKTKSEKIFEDIQRIGYIIDHVRAFSRDHDDYIVTSFNINESIKNAISMISEQFKHHGIKLTSKLEKNVHPINGNTYKFEQVILNLLNNAKDALEEKARLTNEDFEKTIRIRTYYDDHTNFVEIKDNGIGIKTEDIDRIMFPFYTTKEVGKGTGLGLSISFGIIKELNGNIDIESSMLSGTTFRISIPKPFPKEQRQN
jgi:PAS domain S-box-containing protein